MVELMATGGCGGRENKLELDNLLEKEFTRAVEPLNQAHYLLIFGGWEHTRRHNYFVFGLFLKSTVGLSEYYQASTVVKGKLPTFQKNKDIETENNLSREGEQDVRKRRYVKFKGSEILNKEP